MRSIAKNQFIGEYKIPEWLCDDLINFHKNMPMSPPDAIKYNKNYVVKDYGRHGNYEYTKTTKDSTDVLFKLDLLNNSKIADDSYYDAIRLLNAYKIELDRCFKKYRDELFLTDPFQKDLDDYAYYAMDCCTPVESMIIQHYQPSGGFHIWHSERNGDVRNREFVFTTYLNNVPDGGTEFFNQEKIVKAEKGKTVIFPAGYTHIHRGQISHTQEKYIMTGWYGYNFPSNTM